MYLNGTKRRSLMSTRSKPLLSSPVSDLIAAALPISIVAIAFMNLQIFQRWWMKSGDGFGNQSDLMVHLLTLANLLVQFQCKQRPFLFSIYLNNEPRTFSNVQVPLNNLTMFLRYDKMCVTLFTELDVGRYVNNPATGRNDDRYMIFCNWTRRQSVRDIFCNCTRRRSFYPKKWPHKFSDNFGEIWSVSTNVTRTEFKEENNLQSVHYFVNSFEYSFTIILIETTSTDKIWQLLIYFKRGKWNFHDKISTCP